MIGIGMLSKKTSYILFGISIVCLVLFVIWMVFFQLNPDKVVVIIGASEDQIFSMSDVYDVTDTGDDLVLLFPETTDSAFSSIQRAENYVNQGAVHIFLYGDYIEYLIDYIQEDVSAQSAVIIDSRFAADLPADVLERSSLMDLSNPEDSFSDILLTYARCQQVAVACFK
jgi:hypothetical protein